MIPAGLLYVDSGNLSFILYICFHLLHYPLKEGIIVHQIFGEKGINRIVFPEGKITGREPQAGFAEKENSR